MSREVRRAIEQSDFDLGRDSFCNREIDSRRCHGKVLKADAGAVKERNLIREDRGALEQCGFYLLLAVVSVPMQARCVPGRTCSSEHLMSFTTSRPKLTDNPQSTDCALRPASTTALSAFV